MSKSDEIAALAEALARIETRQAVYETVAHRMIGMMEVHNEKLDAILEATTREAGPSPVAVLLTGILTSMQEQAALLSNLPSRLAETIRDEMQRELEAEGYDTEPGGPGDFAEDADGKA